MFKKSKNQKTVWEKFPELKTIPEEKFPKHLLLIPDGNGRWQSFTRKTSQKGIKQELT